MASGRQAGSAERDAPEPIEALLLVKSTSKANPMGPPNASPPPPGETPVADRGPRRRGTGWYRSGSVSLAVFQFMLAGVVTMGVVSVGATLLLRRTDASEAVRSAKEVAAAAVRGAVQPNLTNEVAQGQPAALARFDALIHREVLDGSLVRVKLWAADGTIVYSDEPRLVGKVYPLGPDDLRTLRDGTVTADLSDLSQPENQYERPYHRLLQVYQRVITPDGQPMLFESYLKFSSVTASAQRIWLSTLPSVLGALLLLELAQAPLAASLARKVRSGLRRQQALMRRAIEASDDERRRIAGDLHDGVVQDLAAANFVLAAAAGKLGPDDRHIAADLELVAATNRRSVGALRTLLAEIYPPNLHAAGLQESLRGVCSALVGESATCSIEVQEETEIPTDTEALLFRTAREAIRNAVKHAGATRIDVVVDSQPLGVRLVVADDGVGFDPHQVMARPAHGHLGLRLLSELAVDAGGSLAVESRAGAGTRVVVEVPYR
jgi:two-component system NarL family sensor kinase